MYKNLKKIFFVIFIFCTITSFFFNLDNVSAQSLLPKKADIAKIYNIETAATQKVDVRYYRKGECDDRQWCNVRGEGEYLKAKDFLQTGEVSRTDLALMYNEKEYSEVLFWQQEGSRSEFLPQPGTCHFKVDAGGFLYAHPHQNINPGCERIVSKNALVFPNGTALFINVTDETLVGVLSNRQGSFIKIQHSQSNNTVELKAGEYAKALKDGKIIKGVFDLEDFYRKNQLSLGLGPSKKDDDYVDAQEPEIRNILIKLREETLDAIRKQDKTQPTTPIDVFTPQRPPQQPVPPPPPPLPPQQPVPPPPPPPSLG
jgi:hypothetical protein